MAELGFELRTPGSAVRCPTDCAVKLSSTYQDNELGPVVQSVVSLTSSLVVKMLTFLVSTILISQVFLLKKCE